VPPERQAEFWAAMQWFAEKISVVLGETDCEIGEVCDDDRCDEYLPESTTATINV
jgi:hypothetical protein